MMKWFRAHTKQIMVGLVLLAMISFVGGQALYSIMGRATTSEVVMRVVDREVE